MDGVTPEFVRNQNETLAEVGNIKIIRPNPPAIPISEGNHLQVATGERIPWRQRPAKELLRMAFFALPTAKVLSEGRNSEDFWANIHMNSRPPFETGVNVFGRNPESPTGWGKPVNTRDLTDQVVTEGEEAKSTGPVLERYVGLWERLLPQVELFPRGSVGSSHGSEILLDKGNNRVIWDNERFNLVVIRSPHLSGLHLVVSPKQEYWEGKGGFKRAWQVDRDPGRQEVSQEHIQGFLEAAAIINGAERVLLEGENGLPFYNPEVHFSGNWAGDLKTEDQGGKLSTDYLTQNDTESARKAEKRAHRVGASDEWQTGMHGHLYATRDPNKYVSLPSRPQSEVPNQWEGITPLSQEEENQVFNLINQNLTPWLDQNASGKL